MNHENPTTHYWTFNPWSKNPAVASSVIFINLAITVTVYFLYPEKIFAVLALLVMFGMTATLYLPVSYRLDEEGVAVFFLGTRTFRKWSHYRNYYLHRDGVFLTSMPMPSRLDPFRGHFLRYDGDKNIVIEYVKAHVKRIQEEKGEEQEK